MNTKWPGDIFLTRNIGVTEEQNESPGYFNHAAIYVGNNFVVEAQIDAGVIKVDLDAFLERYPIVVGMRNKANINMDMAVQYAISLVGLPYRKISSIFSLQRNASRGINCVSVVRLSYTRQLENDPGWKIPDNIFYDTNFVEVFRKYDEEYKLND